MHQSTARHAQDCNARDRRRLRRRARALLFWRARSRSASPRRGVQGDRETSGRKTRRQPHLSACRADCRAVRISQLRVNSQRAANTLDTLRRALEHSADYAGRSPDSAVCGAAHNLCVMFGCPPKTPFQGDGGSAAPRATVFRAPGTNIILRSRSAHLPVPQHPRRRAAPRRSRVRTAPPPHRERSRAPTAACRGAWRCGSP